MNQQQLIRSIIKGVGELIDKKAETLETNLRGEMKSGEKGLKEEIRTSEGRESKRLEK